MTGIALTGSPSSPSAASRSAPPGSAAGRGFRPDIEGLRAVAVLAVVLGHAGVPFLPGGYVGVDVFFVISGFLITTLLLGELRRTGRISIATFYARRARRLLPAAAVVAVFTVVGAWALQSPMAAGQAAADALWTVAYAFNVKLAADGTNYLHAEAAPSLLQHYWSLAVEEQFYLVWPVLLMALAGGWHGKRRRHRAASRTDRVRTGRVAAALATVIAGSLALSVWQTSVAQPWAYFGLHTRAWELATGALVAVAAPWAARLWRPAAVLLGSTGLVAVVASAVVFTDDTAFPGYAAALPVVGTALVLVAGFAAPASGAGWLLGTGPLQVVGRLSYGWYLWHWPLLTLLPLAVGMSPSLPVLLGASVVALGFAWVSLHTVENPVRFARSLAPAPEGLALGFAVSSVVTLVAVAVPLVPGGRPSGAAVTVASASGQPDLAEVLAQSLEQREAPGNLTPEPADAAADLPRSRGDGCHVDLLDDEPKRPCTYGDPDGARTLLLFGDSHADQWLPALDEAAATAGWRVVHRTKSACPPASMDVRSQDLGRDYPECSTWRDAVLDEARSLRPDLVVMGASYGIGDDPQEWAEGMTTTTDRLRESAGRVVLVADTPVRSSPGPDCVAAHLDDVRACALDRSAALPHTRTAQAVADAVEAAGGEVVDPSGWFCTADACPAVVGNYLVHRDATHVTATYARFLAPRLDEELRLS
jgi:peptidoglycan/LPS O-acetylase OafA/YrhL